MFEKLLIYLLKKYQKKLPHDNLKFENDIDDKIYFESSFLIHTLKEKLEG